MEIDAVYPGRVDVNAGDALGLDEAVLLRERGVTLPVPVVANLPYNVGTALLIKWLSVAEWPPWWSSLTLLFQREVAERICAHVGGEAYGRLSVLAQWRTKPTILFDIDRRTFVPPPKVTSAVVRFEPLPKPRFEANLADLEKVTAAAFGQRRKMLRQSLKTLTSDTDALIRAAGVMETARAEELSVAQFCALARAYAVQRIHFINGSREQTAFTRPSQDRLHPSKRRGRDRVLSRRCPRPKAMRKFGNIEQPNKTRSSVRVRSARISSLPRAILKTLGIPAQPKHLS